jgi:stage V sporulation protein SpoVS
VKDAAGAITKVLNRLASTFVTALQEGGEGRESSNRAVKALAVGRKYVRDTNPGQELGFYPLNRSNSAGVEDPNLFAFLVRDLFCCH